MIFTEIREGPLSSEKIAWLVSCKDKAKSGDSVSERDLPHTGVIDKVKQHRANAFLLVTTTTISTGAKELLDRFDKRQGGEINTLVWDAAHLRSLLLDVSNQDLLKEFLPESYKRYKGLTSLEGAILSFSEELPSEILERLLHLIKPFSISPLRGEQIWPHDRKSAQTIDAVIRAIFVQEDFSMAATATEEIEYDAFIALVNTLHDNYSEECFKYLAKIILEHGEPDVRFNAAQFLFDNYEISRSTAIRIAAKLDEDALEQLYTGEITQFVMQEVVHSTSSYRIQNALDNLPGWATFDDVHLSTLKIQPRDSKSIEFSGELGITIEIVMGGESVDSPTFYGEYKGYFDEHGMYLEEAGIDTKNYLADDNSDDEYLDNFRE